MQQPTEEQLAQMSPEQLAEVQKQQCIFCQIIAGKVSSKQVYEDDKCMAILDINPANPGHVLILPREHFTIMQMMPDPRVEHLFKIAQKISLSQIKGLGVEGTNIFVANGSAAGQKAPHSMIHVIPRKKNDGITAFHIPKNQIAAVDQEKLRVAIKMKVNERFGIQEQVLAEPVEELPEEQIPPPEEAARAAAESLKESEEEQAAQKPATEEYTQQSGEEAEETPEEEWAEEEQQDADAGRMMHIPSPDDAMHPEEHEEDEEKERPKKKFNLDSISKLFK
jgi:histidine triad (HIT) family protein